MKLITYVPLVLGLAMFSLYYFSLTEEKSLRFGFNIRIFNAVVSTIMMAFLVYLFAGRHYEFKYVYENSDNSLSALYRVSATWAGQPGTLLLWFWMTAVVFVFLRGADKKSERAIHLAGSLVLVTLGVLLVNAPPFEKLPAGMIATNGQGLNPLLVNFWMAVHPPLIFIGYALVAAPFSLAIAGVLSGDYSGWVRQARIWSLISWGFLSAGIFLGSYWAYEVLGWGGYWGWDPVENASVFPWLAVGALTHGLLIQGGKKKFAVWNVLLALGSFLMVMLATFLTRSGALSSFSVHSFEKNALYYPLCISLAAFIVFSIAVAIMAARGLKTDKSEIKGLTTAQSLLAYAILGLLVFLAFISVGTFFPLFTQLAGKPTTVGTIYYNATAYLVSLGLGGLLIVCPFFFVKTIKGLTQPVRMALSGIGVVLAVLLVALARAKSPEFYFLAAVAGAVIASNILTAYNFAKLGRWNVASYVVHFGVGLLLLGVLTSSSGATKDLQLLQGDTAKYNNYQFRFTEIQPDEQTQKVKVNLQMTEGDRVHIYKTEFPIEAGKVVIKPVIERIGSDDVYIAPKGIEIVQVPTGAAAAPQTGNTVTITNTQKTPVSGYELQFDHWGTSDNKKMASHTEGMASGGMAITAVVNLYKDGQKKTIVLPFGTETDAAAKKSRRIKLDDGTILELHKINVVSHTAGELIVQVTKPGENPDAAPAVTQQTGQMTEVPRVYFTVTHKPFILLLWWGMILITAGTFAALLTKRFGASAKA